MRARPFPPLPRSSAPPSRRFPLLALALLGLCACVPRSAPADPDLRPLERAAYTPLLAPFLETLRGLGAVPEQAYGYAYSGENPGAFQAALRQFYATYPGVCPLEGQSFFPAEDGVRFMTVAVGGRALRAFVYDHSALPRLRYLFLEATVPIALEGSCPRP